MVIARAVPREALSLYVIEIGFTTSIHKRCPMRLRTVAATRIIMSLIAGDILRSINSVFGEAPRSRAKIGVLQK